MKTALAMICLAAATLPGDVTSPELPGRFQIVTTTVRVLAADGAYGDFPTIIKLDTSTGKTWKFVSQLGPSTMLEGWSELSTPPTSKSTAPLEKARK